VTGIVIFPAGRDDAFEDYERFVRDGYPLGDIESYLTEDETELFRTTQRMTSSMSGVPQSKGHGETSSVTISHWSIIMGASLPVGRSSIYAMIPTSPSTSGRKTSTTIAGMTKAHGSI